MAASSTFTVGIVQEAVTNDVDKNVERAVARIREAAEKGAQIVCLQELFNAPYFCKSQKHERFDLAEPIPGPTIDRMRKLARELELVIIVRSSSGQAAAFTEFRRPSSTPMARFSAPIVRCKSDDPRSTRSSTSPRRFAPRGRRRSQGARISRSKTLYGRKAAC